MLEGKLKFIVAILIIGLAISYLVFSGVKNTMVYYLTINELKAKVPEIYEDRVRVSGTVVSGTIKNTVGEKLEFVITDGTDTIHVNYSGIVPDIFAADVEAVVEGKYKVDNTFDADILLAKCPTKYESLDQLDKYKKENS